MGKSKKVPVLKPEICYRVWTSRDGFGASDLNDADRYTSLNEAREEASYLHQGGSRNVRIFKHTMLSRLTEVKQS